MLIKELLFYKVNFMRGQPSLSSILDNHRQKLSGRIRDVASLEAMTDAFLAEVIEDAIVEPIVFQFDKRTQSRRQEDVHVCDRNARFIDRPDGNISRMVCRIKVPFSGDPQLLDITPQPSGLSFPLGEVVGKAIQFDVVLWDEESDQLARDIEDNCRNLQQRAAASAADVKKSNEMAPKEIEAAFQIKFEQLKKQHAIFDKLGIPEETAEPELSEVIAPNTKPSRVPKGRRPQYIIQFVQTQLVERLTQINKNTGDVNNAIQSNQ